MSFEEPDRRNSQLRGQGWRRLPNPAPTNCYIGGTWMTQPVCEVNDETHAVRVMRDTVDHGMVRDILEPWAYRDQGSLFALSVRAQAAVPGHGCHAAA